jgi:hypothetical protein
MGLVYGSVTRLASLACLALVASVLAVFWSRASGDRAARGGLPVEAGAPVASAEPSKGTVETTPRLLVRVLDEETGAPIPACRIVATPWEGPGEFIAATDDAGEASFDRLCGRVRAERRGYVPGVGEVWLARALLVLELRPAVPVPGRVVRAGSGAPVEGASVEISDIDGDAALADLVTDREGRFEVPGIAPGTPFLVVAYRDGLAAVGRVERRPEAGREIVLELGGGAVIEGRVVWPDERAAAGASVIVTPCAVEPLLQDFPGGHWYFAEATADDQGNFRIEGLRTPADYEVTASDDEFARGIDYVALRVADESAWASIRLEAHTTVVVDVVLPPGEPPARASVTLRQGDDTREVENDHAVFDLKEGGPCEVVVQAPNWPLTRQLVNARTGARNDVVVALSRRGHSVVSGRVRDEAGVPLQGICVFLSASESEHETRTAADGSFHICDVPPAGGTLYVISGLHETWSRDDVTCTAPTVDVVLRVEARFVGRVDPVPRSRALLLHMDSDARRPLDIDEDGSFEIPWAAGHPVLIGFEPTDGAPLFIEAPPLDAGTVHDLGILRFEAGFTAEAVVLDDGGRPVPDAQAVLEIENLYGERSTRTDALGRFRFARLPHAPLRVAVSAPGFVATALDLHGPRELHHREIALSPEGLVEGVVLDPEGQHVPGHAVGYAAADDDDSLWSWGYTDSLGRFRFRLAPGRYRMETGNDDYQSVEVRARQTTRVEFRLKE